MFTKLGTGYDFGQGIEPRYYGYVFLVSAIKNGEYFITFWWPVIGMLLHSNDYKLYLKMAKANHFNKQGCPEKLPGQTKWKLLAKTKTSGALHNPKTLFMRRHCFRDGWSNVGKKRKLTVTSSKYTNMRKQPQDSDFCNTLQIGADWDSLEAFDQFRQCLKWYTATWITPNLQLPVLNRENSINF